MLDGSDIQTFHSLRLLDDSISDRTKPILFWIGAGASAWCGYPLWSQFAELMHSNFLKFEPNYNKKRALELLESTRYPEFFEICKAINKQRYHSIIVDSFKTKSPTPVYERFIQSLDSIKPHHVITTNVDELLENSLPAITTIQRSNLERCIDLIQEQQSFVCKIHGSVSSVETTIFTSDEYGSLTSDDKYLELLKFIFTQTTVVFIGYGLADDYVLRQLFGSAELRNIFGNGPHFAIAPHNVTLPETVKPIRYIPQPQKDHRSAIQVVEEIRTQRNMSAKNIPATCETKPEQLISAHLLSHIYPPGEHRNTTIFKLQGNAKMVMGNGLTDNEIPHHFSTAMHDLMVGLLCFDTVYAILPGVGQLHNLIGTRSLVELIVSGAVKFVLRPTQEVVLFRNYDDENGGVLNTIFYEDKSGDELFDQQVRRILKPIKEMEGDEHIEDVYELIKSATIFYSRQSAPDIRDLVGGLLLRSSMRNLIGMSGGTSLTSLPKWMVYPILRLASVVSVGITCQLVGIPSTKLEYGESALAGPAFAAPTGNEWADGMASYVLAGRFDNDLGMYNLRDSKVLSAILKFRSSSFGISLRKEILDQLRVNQGGDFVASVNAALKAAIPSGVLQQAHDKLTGLLMAEGVIPTITPALWNNPEYAKIALKLWKQKSAQELDKYCKEHGINQYDRCPCNSGEKLRFCCAESLSVKI
jgi:hypothetical protein